MVSPISCPEGFKFDNNFTEHIKIKGRYEHKISTNFSMHHSM